MAGRTARNKEHVWPAVGRTDGQPVRCIISEPTEECQGRVENASRHCNCTNATVRCAGIRTPRPKLHGDTDRVTIFFCLCVTPMMTDFQFHCVV